MLRITLENLYFGRPQLSVVWMTCRAPRLRWMRRGVQGRLDAAGPEARVGVRGAPTPTYGAWKRKTLQSAVFSLSTLDFLL